MDLILHVADEFLLDKVWSSLVPACAFYSPPSPPSCSSFDLPATINSTSANSFWHSLITSLPHPPLPSPSYLSSKSAVSAWPRDYVPRQLLSLTVITLIGIFTLYFVVAGLSYAFIFNHEMKKHPRFLKNQVKLEIICSMWSFPGMTALTLPWFQAEVMGYTRLYDDPAKYGWVYMVLSVPLFLFFTDYCIYWIHRILHHPLLYKHIHKPHHKWLIPTPFASHAFHPVDGFSQSLPYHIFIYIFPIQRHLYLGLFIFVNCWSIFIHDSDMITGHPLEHIINGPAHHTLHHLYFTCNYGQYFTWADRVGNSYRKPEPELDPLLEVKRLSKEGKAAGSKLE